MKESLFSLIGIQSDFVTVLYILALVLILSFFFNGTDFGIFKIPKIRPAAKVKVLMNDVCS